MFELISIFGIGALASFLGGLVGLGGGFILVPLLTLFLKMDIKIAILFSLVSLIWAGLQQTLQNRRIIQAHAQLLRPLIILVAIGSGASALIGLRLSSEALNTLLGVTLLSLSLFMYLDRHWEAGPVSGSHRPPKISYLIFVGSGALGGLLGLGGGIFNVPTFHKVFRQPIYESTRLNFPLILVSAAVALSVFFFKHRETLHSIAPLTVLLLILGTASGASMSKKIDLKGRNLKLAFALMTAVMGVLKLMG